MAFRKITGCDVDSWERDVLEKLLGGLARK